MTRIPSKASKRARRGSATFAAVFLIGFVAVAAAALTESLARESHRTAEEAKQAQQRQLVFAASLQAAPR